MGVLVLIANHTKKEVIHPIAKFGELELDGFWQYVLINLLYTAYDSSPGRWSGDSIEIISESADRRYDKAYDYKDITEEMKRDYIDDYRTART